MGADPTFRRPVHLTGLSLLALSFQALGEHTRIRGHLSRSFPGRHYLQRFGNLTFVRPQRYLASHRAGSLDRRRYRGH